MNETVIISFAAIILTGSILIAVMSFTKRGSSKLDCEYFQSRWLKIENQLTRDNESSHHLCILDAEKLVDAALMQRGFAGKTMADRLKSATKQLSNRNAVWSAHKLRNKIAHEADVRVSYDEARAALGGFKQALKDLGAF